MAKSSLAKKLLMKPGQRVVILNPPPGYLEKLAPFPEGVELAEKPTGTVDFVQLFVTDSKELARLAPKAIRAAKHDALLWISYPKRSSKVETDLTRDVLWELVKPFGLVGVSLIAIDDVWSAMRFRPAGEVGK
jgi:hypothetical protein